jgi:hypothetical protein
MILEGRVGEKLAAEGAIEQVRLSRFTEGVFVEGHPRLYEAARLGKLHAACTAAAGVAPGTALSTTPPLTLYNPQNSGKLLVPVRAAVGYVSGTLGAGTIVYGVNATTTQAAPASGTELTPQCTLVGSPKGVARVYQGSTLAAAPTIYRPMCVLSAFLATSDVGNMILVDQIDGELALLPGASMSLQGIAAAGSSPLVLLAMVWEEIVQ